MPHFIIRGADKETAKDSVLFGFFIDSKEADTAAFESNIYISSIEMLDGGAEPRSNDGESGGWLRMATILKKQQRIEEAIEILHHAYRLEQTEETESGISTYLRLPKYLIIAGRKDEAWGYLNQLNIGIVPGVGKLDLLPAGISDIHKTMSDCSDGETSQAHALVSRVALIISETFVGRIDPDQASDGIYRLLEDSNIDSDSCGFISKNIRPLLSDIKDNPKSATVAVRKAATLVLKNASSTM